MWEHVKALNSENLKDEVAKWVLDLGSTVGQLLAYGRIIDTFQLMEILIFNVLMDHENKVAGDKDPIRAWKGHNWDYRLMYRKIDIMEIL